MYVPFEVEVHEIAVFIWSLAVTRMFPVLSTGPFLLVNIPLFYLAGPKRR